MSRRGRSKSAVVVRPVTEARFADLARLFEARGGPHFCWCSVYRFAGVRTMSKAEKKSALHGLVRSSTPVGVLAYDGDEPIGWCSIAPRQTYARLARSRTMPRKTPETTPTWVVLCFFVPRPHRKSGVAHALLRGALDYAQEQGAEVVEGYPFDTSAATATHRGHSSMFKAAGFRRQGRRWSIELGRGR